MQVYQPYMSLLANQIWQCIDLDLLDGAELLAEQLVANENSADTRYLLGYVQSRRGQHATALLTCENHLDTPGCLWVYVQCCLKTGQALKGIAALDNNSSVWALDDDLPLPSPLGRGELSPAAFYLMNAKLKCMIDPDSAVDDYVTSTRLNPYLFENVIALCQSVKIKLKTDTLFSRFEDAFEYAGSNGSDTANAGISGVSPQLNPPHQDDLSRNGITKTTTSTPRRYETPRRVLSTPIAPPKPPAPPSGGALFGPSPSYSGHSSLTQLSSIVPSSVGHIFTSSNFGAGNFGTGIFQTPNNASKQVPLLMSAKRRSGNENANSGNALPNRRLQDRMHSLSFKRSDQTSLSSLGKNVFAGIGARMDEASTHANTELTGVAALEAIAEAVDMLTLAEFTDAITLIKSLALPIQQTPFVLALAGRLYLEMGEYERSVEQFNTLRKIQPDRTRGLEYMSTALWHLKRDSELSILGHELNKKGSPLRHAWQSWCVLGNAFSLRNDTQNAIKCFQRACQIDSSSAYAHALMGYEYCGCDELKNASECFSKALQKNPLLYNAWYGLGTVYFNLGDYEKAEIHFAQAIRLNPKNPVLLCYMGTVYEVQGDLNHALLQFDRAREVSPNSPIPRYRKAEALIEAEMFKDALDELLDLESLAPEDSSVQFAIAKAYQGLGHTDLAIQRLTIAQHLAPKSTALIRKMMESM